jgi:ubiquinone/menaquinone biosynthesis C-methylase UbiE
VLQEVETRPVQQEAASAARPRKGLRALRACAAAYGLIFLAVLWHYYPNRTDPPEVIHFQPTTEQQEYYDGAFAERQAKYAAFARKAAENFHIKENVADFIASNGLGRAHVLEVGSGEGSLQDMVSDYTGLDISATAQKNYHKRFVQADARAMPFPDGEFDAAFSIWVLEHVPNPEQALREMRRVLKPNGLLYLSPAWFCPDFAAQGYRFRPYSDFNFRGKLIKATVPLQLSPLFEAMHVLPIRAGRLAAWSIHHQPTDFHYRALEPNYRDYWMADSDAVNSMDPFEAYLWFVSRGDECLNCGSRLQALGTHDLPLVIRVKPVR